MDYEKFFKLANQKAEDYLDFKGNSYEEGIQFGILIGMSYALSCSNLTHEEKRKMQNILNKASDKYKPSES